MQLRPDRPRPRASGRGGGGRAPAGARRLPERPVAADGGAGGAAGRSGAARRLGHVREERHRRHDARRLDRPRGDGPPEDAGRAGRLPRLGPVVHAAAGRDHARGPGAPHPVRLQRPGQRRGGRRSGRAATWPGSWCRRSATTPGSIRRNATRRSPGACGPSATAGARSWLSTTCAPASGSTSAGAGSSSASGPTSPPTARRSRTAIRWRRSSGGTPCARRPSRSSSPAPSGSRPSRWRPPSRRSRPSRPRAGSSG